MPLDSALVAKFLIEAEKELTTSLRFVNLARTSGYIFSERALAMCNLRYVHLAASILLSAVLFACGDSSNSHPVTSIDISPISPTITVGATQQFTATGHFSDGSTGDLTHQANWSSSVVSVATIQSIGTQPGLASGVNAGNSQITVSFAQGSSSVTASTNLTVTN